MRLKTKLVLAATGLTFTIVLVLSALFLAELLKQRIQQSAASDDVMAQQVMRMTRQAVQEGLTAHPPVDGTPEALHAAVADALRSNQPLNDTMDSLVRYSTAVQDAYVTDANGWVLVSTDPTMWNQPSSERTSFDRVLRGGIFFQLDEVFGRPQVLDVARSLDRNGQPFLIVHVGVRSSFLKNYYVPRLKYALGLALLFGLVSMSLAALLANVALQPMEDISRRLQSLTAVARGDREIADAAWAPPERPRSGRDADTVVQVSATIEQLGRQMRTTEAGYTTLQANLNQMLDTLRDGVVLFTPERRAVMVSDAVAQFIPGVQGSLVGLGVREMFREETALGRAVLSAFDGGTDVSGQTVRMEDGRDVVFSLDRFDDGRVRAGRLGALLTLRDSGSAMRLERELEVSQRLAAVGRLTAGVGHEVKNPINAMVVHLELLRSKLQIAGQGRSFLGGAMRHVDILAGEMDRLDRVVQTLADFTRPMELHLKVEDLGEIVDQVIELANLEMAENKVEVECQLNSVMARVDGELLRQAMLNLTLNAMQAMPEGGRMRLRVWREEDWAVMEVADEGEGIAPDLMPRIFDLYFTTKAKGSGIGLAMTYRIVQMHGGAVAVESAPGQGATFTIRLPVAETEMTGKIQNGGRAATGEEG